MNKSMYLYYHNLPKSWADYDKNNFSISNEKYNQLLTKFKNLPNSIIIYMQNACKLFVPQLVDKYKFIGIDFIDYFDSVFKQERGYEVSFDKDIYVIYNIGLEKALNTDFSSRMLLGLIEKIKNENKIIFLCSHLSYTDFYKKYNIEVVNRIGLKEKQEEKFI